MAEREDIIVCIRIFTGSALRTDNGQRSDGVGLIYKRFDKKHEHSCIVCCQSHVNVVITLNVQLGLSVLTIKNQSHSISQTSNIV